jgi:hypothetical protein
LFGNGAKPKKLGTGHTRAAGATLPPQNHTPGLGDPPFTPNLSESWRGAARNKRQIIVKRYCRTDSMETEVEKTPMRKYLILAAVLLLSSVTTTEAQDVRYNFAQGEDFSKYKTYKWVDLKGADQANELTEKQIKQRGSGVYIEKS